MDDLELGADVFAVPQLWKTSRWLDDGPAVSGQFFSTQLRDVDAIDLDFSSGTSAAGQATHTIQSPALIELKGPGHNEAGFFKLPAFDTAITETTRHEKTPISSAADQGSSKDDGEIDDIWTDVKTVQAKQPSYKTWDGFLSGDHPESQPLYLSEAGPAAYDALLDWDTDPLDLRNNDVPMVDVRAYLASLLSLAVGRESVFFLRIPGSHSFKPALSQIRLSGYSSHALRGLESKCLNCGETILSLKAFVQKAYTKESGRCTVALSSALDRILQILQQQIDVDGQSPRSILQLQSTINNVSGVLRPLKALMAQVASERSEERILDLVFKHACIMECKETFVREILQEILRIVSMPWLELLEEWIGTKPEHGLPFTKASVGHSKGFVKVESETCIDDFGEEYEDVDYRLDTKKLPDFFPRDLAQLAFDTGKNLRFIRASAPDHSLARAQTARARQNMDAPGAEWTFTWQEVLQSEQGILRYKASLRATVPATSCAQVVESSPGQALTQSLEQKVSVFGSDELQIEAFILSSMKQFEAPIRQLAAGDRFANILKQNLHSHILPRDGRDSMSAPHPSLLPVLSFGGIVSVQAEVINRESLKLLFDRHDLRAHLDIHRSFHLLGNGLFCTQLSHALFDPDLETAERQAGVARQGGVMGLRLGARDTWPPASSELRLALMGILTESFGAEKGTGGSIPAYKRDTDALPGDLSFAVRDLPPEDIEKCMNPDSLEAMDFLRLAYTPPPELRVIISPVTLMQYDRIFKFLVRLLRLMYVGDQLFRIINLKPSEWHEPTNTAYRFSREARHFVSCVSAYFLDTGIAQPWQAFQIKMDEMQAELSHDGSGTSEIACSPETLGDYHSQAVQQIMSALFLRKRQQAVVKLLEDIFVTILAYAKHARLQSLGSVVEGSHTAAYSEKLYKDFKKKVQVFITVCRSLTEKTKSGARGKQDGAAFQDGLGEDSMIAQLLLKLDMNNYYTKS